MSKPVQIGENTVRGVVLGVILAAALLAAIEKLAMVDLTSEYPDMSKALGLLREIIHRRSGSE